LNDNVTGGVRSVSEAGSRQSVYNVPVGMASVGKQNFATTDQVRIVKGPGTGTFKNEILNITVQPTHVYMAKQEAKPFNVAVNTAVREKLNVSAQAQYSNSINHVPHSYTENSIKLRNSQPKGTFMPSNQIEKEAYIKDVSYTLRNPRLSMSGFEVKAPYYLKH
jgi:hypothetical protein